MAVKAPTVQKLAQSMAELEPAYKEQRGLINEQIEGLGAQSEVTRQRLEGAKVNAFNTINDQAIGRGNATAMGGIPQHEQANYLAATFLPGMQDIELQEGKERMQLRGTLANLNMQQSTAALSRIDQQTAALNQWNLSQAQIEAQRREAALNRQFQTSERVASQKFTAGQNAANRAASAASAAPTGPTVAQTQSAFTDWAFGRDKSGQKVGSDKKMSPADFAAGFSKWVQLGGTMDPATYYSMNSQYVNQKHTQDYLKALGINTK